MSNSQNRDSENQDEKNDTDAPSGSYYYDDSTGYEPYDAENENDESGSVEEDR